MRKTYNPLRSSKYRTMKWSRRKTPTTNFRNWGRIVNNEKDWFRTVWGKLKKTNEVELERQEEQDFLYWYFKGIWDKQVFIKEIRSLYALTKDISVV